MQSLFLTSVFCTLIFLGISAPFAAALGFVWVDIVKPQQLAYSIINGAPLSFIAAFASLGLFFIKDRKDPPRFNIILTLLAIFAAWMTFTTLMSTIPEFAWHKWDWAFKVVIFSIFVPYIFRSRIQIEALMLVLVFSASTIFMPAGVKTLAGGGGYGVLAIMGSSNSGLAESSTLAAVCVMLMPLMLYAMHYSALFPRTKWTKLLFLGLIAASFCCVVGTSARTGIIASVVFLGLHWLNSKHKLAWILALAIAGGVVANLDLSQTKWGSRMSTIETYNQDSSALGRLAVWKWTIGYAFEHPLGGGFDAYKFNRIAAVMDNGDILYYDESVKMGKAFHSIYFEVMGEQGLVGFGIYYSTIIISILYLLKLQRKYAKHEELDWLSALATSLRHSILIFLAGGAFVGIAYQPFIFYLIGITISLQQYAARYESYSTPTPNRLSA